MANDLYHQNPALRFLRIPATESTKIVVEDRQNGLSKTQFDIRIGSSGLYDLMRWLVQKVNAYEAKAVRRQRKTSRRTGPASAKVSPVRQRLAVQVLIKNAVCIICHTFAVSCCFADMVNLRNELRMSSSRGALSLTN